MKKEVDEKKEIKDGLTRNIACLTRTYNKMC